VTASKKTTRFGFSFTTSCWTSKRNIPIIESLTLAEIRGKTHHSELLARSAGLGHELGLLVRALAGPPAHRWHKPALAWLRAPAWAAASSRLPRGPLPSWACWHTWSHRPAASPGQLLAVAASARRRRTPLVLGHRSVQRARAPAQPRLDRPGWSAQSSAALHAAALCRREQRRPRLVLSCTVTLTETREPKYQRNEMNKIAN